MARRQPPNRRKTWPPCASPSRRTGGRLLVLGLIFTQSVAARAEMSDDERAHIKTLNGQGLDHYHRADYLDAAAAFRGALARQDIAELHLSLAKALYHAGDAKGACAEVYRFLRGRSDLPPLASDEAQAWRQRACVSPAGRRLPGWLPLVLGGVGAAGVAAGVTLLSVHGQQTCPLAPHCTSRLDSLAPGALTLGLGTLLVGGSSVLLGLVVRLGPEARVSLRGAASRR